MRFHVFSDSVTGEQVFLWIIEGLTLVVLRLRRRICPLTAAGPSLLSVNNLEGHKPLIPQ